MKIKFEIDAEKKIVKIYFQEKEFYDWVERALKDHPSLSNEELSKKGSEQIAYITSKTFQKIGKMVDLDILQFKPEPHTYKHEAELPLHLRETKL